MGWREENRKQVQEEVNFPQQGNQEPEEGALHLAIFQIQFPGDPSVSDSCEAPETYLKPLSSEPGQCY